MSDKRTISQRLAAAGYVHCWAGGGTDHHAVFDRNGGFAGYFMAHEVLKALRLA